jgi:hypothetical protein
MKNYNIINHSLSEEQLREIEGEIISPSEEIKKGLLQSPDNEEAIGSLATKIILEAKERGCTAILAPGGSPALMAIIAIEANEAKIGLKFSHSVRDFSEVVAPDGTATKTNVFRHVRWLEFHPTKYKII